jgi:hypothetical protein
LKQGADSYADMIKNAIFNIPELDKLNLASTRLTSKGAENIFNTTKNFLPKHIDLSHNLLR